MKNLSFLLVFYLTIASPLLLIAGTAQISTAAQTSDCGDANPYASLQAQASAAGEKKAVACTDPRPQVCTQDYRPVCAQLQDGRSKTYSNGCSACADPAVSSYREGACE